MVRVEILIRTSEGIAHPISWCHAILFGCIALLAQQLGVYPNTIGKVNIGLYSAQPCRHLRRVSVVVPAKGSSVFMIDLEPAPIPMHKAT